MFKKTMIAGAVVFASIGAHAASAELTVTGTITPEACTIALDSGGNLNYGKIGAEVVKTYAKWSGTHYKLPAKTIGLSVNCNSPAPVIISVADNKSVTKDGSLADPDIKFSLGATADNKSVGFFQVNTKSIKVQADTSSLLDEAMGVFARKPTSGTWGFQTATVSTAYLRQGEEVFYSPLNGSTRSAADPILKLVGTLSVEPMLSSTVIDNATGDVNAAGSMTLSLVYP